MYFTDIDKQNEIIDKICLELAENVKEKNISYGGSIFRENPLLKGERPEKVIRVEIGHKINRLVFGNNNFNENDLFDMTGYIILLEAYKMLEKEQSND